MNNTLLILLRNLTNIFELLLSIYYHSFKISQIKKKSSRIEQLIIISATSHFYIYFSPRESQSTEAAEIIGDRT